MEGKNRENGPDQHNLERLLRELPLEPVPVDLTDRIMARIPQKRRRFLSGLWERIAQPITISFRPLYAFSIIVVVCGAFIFGRNSVQRPDQHGADFALSAGGGLTTIDNAESAYLIGRGLLSADKSGRGLALLQRASVLEPGNPEYAFWEGVGYWRQGDRQKERESYLRGLAVVPDSIPLLTNLGHNYLSDDQYERALDTYESVLVLQPDQAVSRYNSGLIYRRLKQVDDEIRTWKEYLQTYRTGKWAFRAVNHLNNYGDFSFRTYLVGARKIVISPRRLFDQSLSVEKRSEELSSLALMLDRNDRLHVEVIVFAEQDAELARNRAVSIKQMLVQSAQSDIRKRIGLSWFSSPETVNVGQDRKDLSEGLLIFGRIPSDTIEEVSI